MKKTVDTFYMLFLIVCLLPLSCTTKETAERPQSAPVRQEQDTAAAQPDAVSGATIDSVSGATVSHAHDTEMEHPADAAKKHTGHLADVQPPAVQEPDSDKTNHPIPPDNNKDQQPVIGAGIEASVPASAIRQDTASNMLSARSAPEVQNTAHTVSADLPAFASDMNAPDPSGIFAPGTIESGSSIEQTAASAILNSDSVALDSTHGERSYAQTLADIISEFEEQGSPHRYESPYSVHEQMRTLFSPQVFSVALSKEPEMEQKVKVSRMVAVEEKQRLELTYPGHGWVYVGEQTSQQGLKYEQRKLQDNNSIFMFTAEKKGDYVLHFSYFDVFTNDFITDAVAVSVSAARSSAAKSMVQAPEYKIETETAGKTAQTQPSRSEQAISAQQPERQISDATFSAAAQSMQEGSAAVERTGTADAVNEGTVSESEAAQVSLLSPEQLLENTRTAIAAADANTALQYLERFFTISTEMLDEGWFLKGRAYELNGSLRNIRLALDAYRTLTADFPQSKYWAEADSRIRYITSFYVHIQ